jgi:hypothetical protein
MALPPAQQGVALVRCHPVLADGPVASAGAAERHQHFKRNQAVLGTGRCLALAG